MQKRYEIFADYHQFYLWDHGAMPDAALDYTEEDLQLRVKTAPFLVVIQPERNMSVPVELDILDGPPDEAFDLWDHVVEASSTCPRAGSKSTNARAGPSTSCPWPPAPTASAPVSAALPPSPTTAWTARTITASSCGRPPPPRSR